MPPRTLRTISAALITAIATPAAGLALTGCSTGPEDWASEDQKEQAFRINSCREWLAKDYDPEKTPKNYRDAARIRNGYHERKEAIITPPGWDTALAVTQRIDDGPNADPRDKQMSEEISRWKSYFSNQRMRSFSNGGFDMSPEDPPVELTVSHDYGETCDGWMWQQALRYDKLDSYDRFTPEKAREAGVLE